MQHNSVWWLAKVLEGAGMVVVLVGLVLSVQLGLGEQGLKSMEYELNGLLVGGGLFLAGYVIERKLGAR